MLGVVVINVCRLGGKGTVLAGDVEQNQTIARENVQRCISL